MKPSRNRFPIAAVLAASFAVTATASEYYVATDGVDAAGRGSEASPFHTIQYAIDQAARGDTIWVKPGIYDQGGAVNTVSGSTHMNRVLLTKMVHLKSTDGAAVTHIVGAPDPTTGGIGPNAVRCMASENIDNSRNSTITGFTLRDGYGDTANHRAGGFLQQTGQRDIYFSDCVVSNCVSFTHGGARGGTWARCLFIGNTVTTHGTGTGGLAQSAAAVGSANLIHCVVIGNGDSDNDFALAQDYLINCTVICNRGRPAPNNSDVKCYFYNTVVCGNELANQQSVNTYNRCVTGGYPVFSPLEGDFRLVSGSEACSAGDTSYLSSPASIAPNLTYGKFNVVAGMAGTDFAGNAIDLSAASVHAGAVQETVAAEGGVLYLYGPLSCDGVSVPDGMPTYLQATNRLAQWPVVFSASRTSGAVTTYLRRITRTSGGTLQINPTAENAFQMMAPIKDGVASTNAPIYCKARWVNPATGSDSNDGSEAAPFATIQKAVDAGGSDTVIFLAPGLYNEGGVTAPDASTAPYANTRVWVTNANVRIVGTAGAERTIIVGAPDPVTGGLGDGAWRCIGCNKSEVVFSGVTLSNGWTRATATESDAANAGAAAYATGAVFLTDGVVTDCHGHGDVFNKAYAYRCRVFGNSSARDRIFGGEAGRIVCSWIGPNSTERNSDYYGYIGERIYTFFSTLVATNDTQGTFAVTTWLYNCVVSGGRQVKPNTGSKGNLFWQGGGGDYGTTGISASPKLDADKLHVRETSSALTAGVAPTVAGFDQQEVFSFQWANYSSTDIEGNPIRFNANGTAMAGCSQVPLEVEEFTTLFIR